MNGRRAISQRVLALTLGATLLIWMAPRDHAGEVTEHAPAAVWSLAKCLEHASQHGPGLRSAELRLEDANIDVEESKKIFLPSTRLQAGVYAGGLDDAIGTRFFVGLEVDPIVDGYQDFFAKELAAIQLQLSQLDVKSRRALLFSEIRQAYLLAVGLAKAEHRIAEAIEQHSALVELVGDGEDSNLEALHRIQAEQLIQQQDARLHELEAQRKQQELHIKTLVGLPPAASLSVDRTAQVSSLLGSSSDMETDAPRETAATIRQQLELELAERMYDVSKLDRLPQPILRVGFNEGNPEIESGGYVFLGVDVPLLDWGRLARKRRQLAVEVQRQENDLKEETLRQASQSQRLALLEDELIDRSRALTKAVDLGRRSLAIQVERFETGLGGVSEVLLAQSETARSRAELEINEARLAVLICQQRLIREVGVVSGS